MSKGYIGVPVNKARLQSGPRPLTAASIGKRKEYCMHSLRKAFIVAGVLALQPLVPVSVAHAQEAAATPSTSDERVPLAEVRRFVSVFNAVRGAYVEPVGEQALMQSAIRGLLLDLDPHSVYFPAEDAKAFAEQAQGSYEGIGIEVQVQDDQSLKVIAPIEGGPAEAAGVRAGDVVITVDGKPLSSFQGREPLRGPAGSTVRLELLREGRDKPLRLEVERQAIQLSSLRSRLLEPGYGYVRLTNFQADTGSDFERHVKSLLSRHGALKGIVLDLRGNPGGLLTAAVEVADSLLEAGTIVSTRGRLPISDTQFQAGRGQLLPDVAIVVLVDGGSASASEVLAAALRDNQRARIVGSQTFGKGSVQTVLPLDNGDSVKLTTARYYTPSGRSIQGVGIAPDVVLTAASDPASDGQMTALRTEADLAGHLRGEEEGADDSGGTRGIMLPGEAPLKAALDELKKMIASRRE